LYHRVFDDVSWHLESDDAATARKQDGRTPFALPLNTTLNRLMFSKADITTSLHSDHDTGTETVGSADAMQDTKRTVASIAIENNAVRRHTLLHEGIVMMSYQMYSLYGIDFPLWIPAQRSPRQSREIPLRDIHPGTSAMNFDEP
jgi:hypothetical protein